MTDGEDGVLELGVMSADVNSSRPSERLVPGVNPVADGVAEGHFSADYAIDFSESGSVPQAEYVDYCLHIKIPRN